MTSVIQKNEELKKDSVTHDIPVTYHEIYFTPLKKSNQKLAGSPETIIKFEDVITLILDYANYSAVELNTRDRYTYNIEAIRVNKKGYYELIINCDDNEAEDIIKNNRKKRTTELVSFNIDESHLLRCHIIFVPLVENDGLCARMLLEGNRKVSEQTVRLLLQKIIDQIDKEDFQPDFFKENYAGALSTETHKYEMEYSIKVKTESITNQDFIEKLQEGDFYHMLITEKNILKMHKEAPFLQQSSQVVQFKPIFKGPSEPLANILDGIRKISTKIFGTDKSDVNKEITYKLCYPEGSHKRTVTFDPHQNEISDLAIKRKWINKFKRQNKSHSTIFDDSLCRKMCDLLKDEHEDNDHEKDDI